MKRKGIFLINKVKSLFHLEDQGVYQGQWRYIIFMHGKGILTFANRNKYDGYFRDGLMHGEGTFTYGDGTTYEGQWENGKMHGEGTFTYSDGTTYEGKWENGKMHGYGVFTLADGNEYHGEFKDGERHGKGTLMYPDGTTYKCEFTDGTINKKSISNYAEKPANKVPIIPLNPTSFKTYADAEETDLGSIELDSIALELLSQKHQVTYAGFEQKDSMKRRTDKVFGPRTQLSNPISALEGNYSQASSRH